VSGFDRILCAVEPGGDVAVRQAVLLAGPDAELTLLGSPAAVDAAARIAAEHGVEAAATVVGGDHPGQALIEASGDADLVAVAGGDLVIGALASSAVHAAPVSVLLARDATGESDFPRRVVVATDGSADARRGVALAAAIASARGSELTLVRVDDGRAGSGDALDHGAAEARALGVEPATLERFGDAAREIAEAAAAVGASLLVVGSRGLGRARALGSVGERLAHEAPCSVLIVRGREA
jgi:nucleotide-binding universal stress UspA family protein